MILFHNAGVIRFTIYLPEIPHVSTLRGGHNLENFTPEQLEKVQQIVYVLVRVFVCIAWPVYLPVFIIRFLKK